MQTRFSPAQLADPAIAEADAILRKCVHCGFCLATCPTYVLRGDELDSPRGRIYLIKEMLEADRPADARTTTHIDRCLSCLSCMTTCPASVDYMHLVDLARARIESTGRRPLAVRLQRSLIANVLPYPRRFAAALALGRLARPLRGVLRRLPGLAPVGAMLDLVPQKVPPAAPAVAEEAPVASRRVLMMQGCVHLVLRPDLNAATRRLLERHGIAVLVAGDEGCCGSLAHHMGREAQARAQARRLIDTWSGFLDAHDIDAIVVNVSGCGTTIKDYGHMFRDEPAYAARAARIAALARDVSEVMAGASLRPVADVPRLRVAYHAACSLRHGQKVDAAPRALLATAGFEVVEIAEGHLCCGSAGTYNMLQPALGAALGARKRSHIAALAPDVVAAGNIGCMTQIASGNGVPVVHTVELLDWASGGPRPPALAGVDAAPAPAGMPAREQSRPGPTALSGVEKDLRLRLALAPARGDDGPSHSK